MQNEILANLDNPSRLEKLYRQNKAAFKNAFKELYPEVKDNNLAVSWNARLNPHKEEISWGTYKELIFVMVAALVAGTIAKMPSIFNLNEEIFYSRNRGFILFPALTAYFLWKNKASFRTITILAGITFASLIFINSLPQHTSSDTLILSCMHLYLLLFSLLGIAFCGDQLNNPDKILSYLRFFIDVAIITIFIFIAAAILSGLTIGLFSLIGYTIEAFFKDNIVVFCLPAVPILGAYLITNNPQMVSTVSPTIAKIFSPLVLAMLIIYLITILYTRKDPYNDREFLFLFNALLVGVMALIFFSFAEIKSILSRLQLRIQFFLSAITIIVNAIALSAILYRIFEWGVTPNRMAVVGGNVLILVNLLVVTAQLDQVLQKKANITSVGKAISFYLPVYIVWSNVVTFLFPFLFGFR